MISDLATSKCSINSMIHSNRILLKRCDHSQTQVSCLKEAVKQDDRQASSPYQHNHRPRERPFSFPIVIKGDSVKEAACNLVTMPSAILSIEFNDDCCIGAPTCQIRVYFSATLIIQFCGWPNHQRRKRRLL